MSAEWNHDKICELIEMYREKPALWNPQHRDYHLKNHKQDAWLEIAKKFQCDVDTIKGKMTSLLSSFRREKAKATKSKGTGKGEEKHFANFVLKCVTCYLSIEYAVKYHKYPVPIILNPY